MSTLFVCSYVLFGSFYGKSHVGEYTFSEEVYLILVVCSVVFFYGKGWMHVYGCV